MDWIAALGNINYLAVVIATVSTFVVGAIWYARGVFGSSWMGLVGLDEETMGNANPVIYLWTAIGSFTAALVLAVLMDVTGTAGAVDGFVFGLVLGVAFRVTAHWMHNSFAMRPALLTVVDGLHDVVQIGIMGLIIGLMT